MYYNMFGYNLLDPTGYNAYGMNMTNSLYMMNFYNQLKNYAAGANSQTDAAEKADESGNDHSSGTDFQTAYLEAFRKTLQQSLGISENASEEQNVSNRALSAQTAYRRMAHYGSHPSHIWTSNFV